MLKESLNSNFKYYPSVLSLKLKETQGRKKIMIYFNL